MDEKEQIEEETNGAPQDEGKGKGTLKLAAAAFAVLLLAGGVGLILKTDMLSRLMGGGEEASANTEEEASDIGPIFPMETFIVNLADQRGKRYLKAKLELELDNPEVAEEIERRLPQFRDTILTILSSKSFEDVRALEGKYQLRAEIMSTLNQHLGTGKITNIYMTEFIVQ
ncbi:MAG: flagellar basal body-associated protein FliL [Desulfobacteraceae bacterium]